MTIDPQSISRRFRRYIQGQATRGGRLETTQCLSAVDSNPSWKAIEPTVQEQQRKALSTVLSSAMQWAFACALAFSAQPAVSVESSLLVVVPESVTSNAITFHIYALPSPPTTFHKL